MIPTLVGTVLPWLLGALGCWLVYQLLRQNGRILLRLEAVEVQVAQLSAASAAQAPRGLDPGASAPDFELPDLSGKPVGLARWRGRRVLLIFFNPQCGFCEVSYLGRILVNVFGDSVLPTAAAAMPAREPIDEIHRPESREGRRLRSHDPLRCRGQM